MNWRFTDLDETYAVTVCHAALTYRPKVTAEHADATITLSKATLDQISMEPHLRQSHQQRRRQDRR